MTIGKCFTLCVQGNEDMGDTLFVSSLKHFELYFVIDGVSSCRNPQKAALICKGAGSVN